MYGNKPARILFFIAGAIPTADEYDEAEKLRAFVSFRNAQHVPAEGALEACDGVAGQVPKRYADKYPEAAEAIKTREAERKAALKNTDDRLASAEPVSNVGTGQPVNGETDSRPAWGGQAAAAAEPQSTQGRKR